jgi:hypothetical protein
LPLSPILALHIGAGTVGLLSGSVGISVRQRIFPEFGRKSNVLVFLTVLPLLLLVFWMTRVRFANRYQGKPLLRTSRAPSGST